MLTLLLSHSRSHMATLEPGETAVIGRSKDCNIRLPTNDVSRLHARVFWCEALRFWMLQDLESLNGTRVDGRRLEGPEQYPLCHGDRIQIGYFELEVLLGVPSKEWFDDAVPL
jgi:pSer/pThr/pTyr-binding forkhead associated (FHA) protein